MATVFHVLGIRHHGPGSARSVLRALEAIGPDCVLLEGPPDAAGVLSLAADTAMVPPVALLMHDESEPRRAVYYPFAEFSPEWVAIRWGLARGVQVRFMDLPQWHRLAMERDAETKTPTESEGGGGAEGALPDAEPRAPERRDPLGELARAAGFDDGERWWEHVVEHRRTTGAGGAEADLEIFAAVRDAMAALREAPATDDGMSPDRDEDLLREAYMRRSMREAQADGHATVVVVCGAWHAPALRAEALQQTRKDDDARLKSLPKIKTAATWVPWTYGHLATDSGYGAGIRSPGWYEHLYLNERDVLERWMTKVARMLRDEGVDCSSAHVIEAVRLAHALGAMRARPLPDLSDVTDATRSVFCHDSDAPMALIGRRLLVGERLGEVPESTPMVPLQQDLTRLQKSLRLKPEASDKALELDLRKETDLARSHLLHRLRLLGISWGEPADPGGRTKGTFKEPWRLCWRPEFAVALIQAGRYGNTVADAAAAVVREQVGACGDLPALALLIDTVLLSDLPDAIDPLLARVEAVAAVASDVGTLMDAVPPLARASRYGSVRRTDAEAVRRSLHGILPRINAGLLPAVGSVNDEVAQAFSRRMTSVSEALLLLEAEAETADWHATLRRLADGLSHGLLRGKACRTLFDAGALTADDVAVRMSLALSPGTDPAQSAAWVEGFLEGSGLVLVHDARLLDVLDQWVASVSVEAFDTLVPLLRRTFSRFDAPERRQIGRQLTKDRRAGPDAGAPATPSDEIDLSRAAKVLPVLRLLLSRPS